MEINIWSDIRCPFCYIGKTKFELALSKFEHSDKLDVVWRSFELDPTLKTQPGLSIYDYLADLKGMTRDHAEQMNNHVAQVGKEVGLEFNFNKVIIANSFNAHRMIQFAKSKGLGSGAEDLFFKAHFTEGKNIDDKNTLIALCVSIGLSETEVTDVVMSDAFAEDVRQDSRAAQTLGIRGVPFFLFNNKYGVSGAQSPSVFLNTVEKSWAEFRNKTVA